MLHRRTGEFKTIYKKYCKGLQYIFKTENNVYTLAFSGTGEMETAVVNLLSSGDEIVVASCGRFGDRWVELLEA